MFLEERRQKVLDLVSRQGFISLGDLARALGKQDIVHGPFFRDRRERQQKDGEYAIRNFTEYSPVMQNTQYQLMQNTQYQRITRAAWKPTPAHKERLTARD